MELGANSYACSLLLRLAFCLTPSKNSSFRNLSILMKLLRRDSICDEIVTTHCEFLYVLTWDLSNWSPMIGLLSKGI